MHRYMCPGASARPLTPLRRRFPLPSAPAGELRQISKPDWNKEVNEAGKDISVVLHLFNDAVPACRVVSARMAELSAKFKATKFLKIVSTQAIPDYPDRNLPTILIYRNGDPTTQWVGSHIQKLGGVNITAEILEWHLSRVGALESEMTEPPEQQLLKMAMHVVNKKNVNSDSEDEDDY